MSTRSAEPDTGVTVRVDGTGVVRLQWAAGLEVTEAHARAALGTVGALSGGERRPLYVDMTGTATLTRGARGALCGGCPANDVRASRVALVGRSILDRIVGNLAFAVTAPAVPARCFTSQDDALDWLRHVGTRS